MKIAFLDIDDVLNSTRLITGCRQFDDTTAPPFRIPIVGDQVGAELLNRSAEVTGAQFVASSSWVHSLGWRYTLDWLLRSGLDGSHFHTEPFARYGAEGSKKKAIEGWLGKHSEVAVSEVCIVDDDPDLFLPSHVLARRQVVVDGPDGLLLKHFDQIVGKLGQRGGAS